MLTADYVIIGAGSAGCVLAARLSEDSACEVILVEAGDADVLAEIHEPNKWPVLWDSSANWGYVTTRQPGLNWRAISCPRGKVLGGTSSINTMLYVRGDGGDFEHWRALGNAGWGWDDVLPYFRKSEDFVQGESPLHGTGGPLVVSPQSSPHVLAHAFVEAAVECGHPRNDDFNGPEALGAGLYHTTTRHGRRCSTATAFLHPHDARPNLRTLTRSRTLRVLLEGDQASGVEVFRNGHVEQLKARSEVILCAGAKDSPKLLMLSGIGDPASLEPLGVQARHSLPGVGAGLVDHVQSGVFLQTRTQDLPPASSPIAEAGLFMRSRAPDEGYSFDIQIHVAPYSPPWGAARGQTRGMSLSACVSRPRSCGSVKLRSSDPMDPPVIDPSYLQDAADVRLIVEGLRAARLIAQRLVERGDVVRELLPGPAAADDQALEQWARSNAECVWHPACTCRMGHDARAVVDDRLRVHGLRRLRIADASVMPTLTSANTNAPTIMIGEKAADLIRYA